MTTSDINIKINADEKGAVAGLRRLRSEVLNNEKGLDKLARQGKMTGKSLKDAAGMLGPEFQILGDRIDHITGALGDIKGAGLMAKASLVALVAVGAFEVGKMIGDFIFKTKEWEEASKKAAQAMTEQAAFLNKQSSERIAREIKIANLAETSEQRRNELIKLRSQLVQQQTDAELDMAEAMKAVTIAQSNDVFGYGTQDNAIAEEGLRIAKERVSQLREQVALVEKEQSGATGRAAELERREAAAKKRADADREAVKAIEDKAKAEQDAHAIAERLNATQADYLSNLEMELVKIKEGEEAYLRLTLAKQGFNEETINSALALKAEITELSELDKERQKTKAEKDSTGRLTAPGAVQATEARGLTRGIGMRGQDKILAATQEHIKKSQELLAEARRQTELLKNRLPKGAF